MNTVSPLSFEEIQKVSHVVGDRKRLVCEFHDNAEKHPTRITLNPTCARLREHPWYPSLYLIYLQTEGSPYPILRTIPTAEAKRGQWMVTGIRSEEGRPALKLQQVV